ncbi:LOW QUALITY PROTEIN: G-type lectin S-receptor-like serine/threonine-protein kinase SD2-5 [Carica papaya]|uniref:LOW QUALITY PROTEIN: G-type lectin S-receptor-like serine/threonine-protein kinase SD2-5 n=1 Tax=Carica papaya TaxID=3649 RepID=UPI000B8CB159|nr:LOW QUALITY PROTEIN: G-type lectin S-receptor-like serine/threonine-protein kinase SD2-5 [Carica papaya]
MRLCVFSFLGLILLLPNGYCKSDIHVGYRLTLAVPVEYMVGFIGRAYVLQGDQNENEPSFRAALTVEAIGQKYSCSLEVLLGDVRVWNSGHYSKFYTSDICVLELTSNGDLQLTGPKDRVGWRTGTSGQGVERLQIQRTGNLVLVDSINLIKWQSFNFPTDVMLWGQRLDIATRLASFPTNSNSFYTFEIHPNKVALYLNSGKVKYSYWEFKPTQNRNISYLGLGTKGLELYNDKSQIAQIPSIQPPRFLSLENTTGNLGLYIFSAMKKKFEASFQALKNTCDLPLACNPYGICTFSNSCSCIRLLLKQTQMRNSACGKEISDGFCNGGFPVDMLELHGVSSILKDAKTIINITKEACANFCINDCECVAALYSSGDPRECFLYGVVMGVKQVERDSGFSYMVKVPKGSHGNHSKSNVKKWVVVLVAVVDSLIIMLIFGGLIFYFIRKRRKSSLGNRSNSCRN